MWNPHRSKRWLRIHPTPASNRLLRLLVFGLGLAGLPADALAHDRPVVPRKVLPARVPQVRHGKRPPAYGPPVFRQQRRSQRPARRRLEGHRPATVLMLALARSLEGEGRDARLLLPLLSGRFAAMDARRHDAAVTALLADLSAVENFWPILMSTTRGDRGPQGLAALEHLWRLRAVREQLAMPGPAPFTRDQLQELLAYPPGTLGREYAEHMRRFDLDPGFQPPLPDSAELGSLRWRILHRLLRASWVWHDVFHLVSDYHHFGLQLETVLDEAAFQAFAAENLRSPFSATFVSIAERWLQANHPEHLDYFHRLVAEARARGRAAQPLVGYPWNQSMRRALHRIRRELGLVPRRVPPPAAAGGA
jgi:ubiquinone biosynthesis protein Coq4